MSSAMKEFPAARRSPYSKSFAYAAGPWIDIGRPRVDVRRDRGRRDRRRGPIRRRRSRCHHPVGPVEPAGDRHLQAVRLGAGEEAVRGDHRPGRHEQQLRHVHLLVPRPACRRTTRTGRSSWMRWRPASWSSSRPATTTRPGSCNHDPTKCSPNTHLGRSIRSTRSCPSAR